MADAQSVKIKELGEGFFDVVEAAKFPQCTPRFLNRRKPGFSTLEVEYRFGHIGVGTQRMKGRVVPEQHLPFRVICRWIGVYFTIQPRLYKHLLRVSVSVDKHRLWRDR